MEIEDRLAKRLGLLETMPILLKEVAYAKQHKENFRLPKKTLWKFDEEKGSAKLP